MTIKIEREQKETVDFGDLSRGMLFEFNGDLHISAAIPNAPLNAICLKNYKAIRLQSSEQVTVKYGELIVRS